MYNLKALKQPETRKQITRYCNGEISDKEIGFTLDKIFDQEDVNEIVVVLDDDNDEVIPETTPEPTTESNPLEDEMNAAIETKKKQPLVDFAEKYGIDLTEATNNNKRIAAIREWFNNQ